MVHLVVVQNAQNRMRCASSCYMPLGVVDMNILISKKEFIFYGKVSARYRLSQMLVYGSVCYHPLIKVPLNRLSTPPVNHSAHPITSIRNIHGVKSLVRCGNRN